MKIVSGGQTGVDRAALDAALAAGVEAGGWCPEGRRAEDGAIADHYPLTELAGAAYPQRTRQNVLDSDGTLIIYFGRPSGGTEQTIAHCIETGRPYLLVDAQEIAVERAALKALGFVRAFEIAALNVAGPRASGEPRAYDYARRVVARLLEAAASERHDA